jgi:hypothetical protein
MELLTVQFSATSCHFLDLSSNILLSTRSLTNLSYQYSGLLKFRRDRRSDTRVKKVKFPVCLTVMQSRHM